MKVIKKLRQFKGMSQAELAQKVGVSRNYISELERGGKTMSLDLIIKISEALYIHPCLLMCSRIKTEFPVCMICKGKFLKEINDEINDEEFNKLMQHLLQNRKFIFGALKTINSRPLTSLEKKIQDFLESK